MPALSAPLVSAVTAGVLIIIQMALILTVVVARRRGKQSLGDGGDSLVHLVFGALGPGQHQRTVAGRRAAFSRR